MALRINNLLSMQLGDLIGVQLSGLVLRGLGVGLELGDLVGVRLARLVLAQLRALVGCLDVSLQLGDLVGVRLGGLVLRGLGVGLELGDLVCVRVGGLDLAQLRTLVGCLDVSMQLGEQLFTRGRNG